ncbi:MAG TPA: hypothetical protein VF701_12505 [Thermoanaerobaculia bacterium]
MIHIHNGDVIAAVARRAGIPGTHVAFRESLVTGPVIPGDDWLETRAQALAGTSGDDVLRVRTSLLEQEQMLEAAPGQGEIVLWFEHDLYCLVHLVYLLQRFGGAQLSMIWSPEPLTERDEEGLHLLFESRAAVTPKVLQLAADVWGAYASTDPTRLNEVIDRANADFAFLREGLTLHASRFPSRANGLGSIERHVLELLSLGAVDFPAMFDSIGASIPRFGFTDRDILRLIRRLAGCDVPLITISGELPKALLAITSAGENVLRGEVNDLDVNAPDVWLGGAHLTSERQWIWTGSRIEPR